MPSRSAGVLLYRRVDGGIEVLLVHPGGPFWRNKHEGAWQIPKGLIEPGEAPEVAARREVEEELGCRLQVPLEPLGEIRQRGGKIVQAYAAEQELDAGAIRSTEFEMEWPPRSGKRASFPEVDAARWMGLLEAEKMMLPSQWPLVERLVERLRS